MTDVQMVELLVRMDCKGCERTVRKALARVRGVDGVEVDLHQQKVTVIGFVDKLKVLHALRKAGKGAELWNPNQVPDEEYSLNYVQTPHAFAKTYNYKRHGYNIPLEWQEEHSTYLYREEEEEEEQQYQLPTLFSDENPNNCTIM